MIEEESVVERGYRLTLPRRVREALEIKEGDGLVWRVRGKEIIITPKAFLKDVERDLMLEAM